MVKHNQTIFRKRGTNCLSVFDHFVGLALKGVILTFGKTFRILNESEFFAMQGRYLFSIKIFYKY